MTGEWQPIETAPRDGTRVLLYVPPYGAMCGHNSFNLFGSMDHRWHCHSCLDRGAKPTHWMPLPPPPAGETL